MAVVAGVRIDRGEVADDGAGRRCFPGPKRSHSVMSVGASLTLVTSIWRFLLKVAPAESVTCTVT